MPLTNEKIEAIRKATSPMTLSQQVCSLELAKRLKELGVKQHRTSLYKWQKRWFTTENPNDPSQNKVEEGDWAVMDAGPQYAAQPVRNPWWLKEVTRIEEEWYAAFTVAELGELIDVATKFDFPSAGKDWRCGYPYTYKRSDGKWWCIVRPYPKGFQGHLDIERHTESDTEADARAKMLIYLLENNLLTK